MPIFSNWRSFRAPVSRLCATSSLSISTSKKLRDRFGALENETCHNETLRVVETEGVALKKASKARSSKAVSLSLSLPFSFADSSSLPPLLPTPPTNQLLGLHGRDYLDAQIISAYEELASAPPPAGFSRRALDGRGLLLQEALQQLRAARGAAARAGAPRDALPAGLPAGLALDAPLLPGALALLQEVGECEIVLSAGANALRNGVPLSGSSSSSSAASLSIPLPPSAERDVRLAVAHAHCALAGATLEQGSGNGSSSGSVGAVSASSGGSSTDGSSSPFSSVPATAAPISVACAHLAEAAALLAGAPVSPSSSKGKGGISSSQSLPPLAPKLAADVARGLADLAPGCALEQLDLPLDQGHAPVRAAAVAVVAHALRPAAKQKGERKGGGISSPSSASAVTARPASPEFAKAALSRMGATEVASVLDWSKLFEDASPFARWLFPGAMGAAGAAHVVAGFVDRKPSLVDLGERLLAAEADAAAAASGGSPLAPRVAALVLLGEPEAAATLLTTSAHALEQAAASSSRSRWSNSGGLSSAAARARAAAADVEFVAAASRAVTGGAESLDALPGLVALTEEWLSRGGFPAFRDTAERPPSPKLSGYFDDGRVAAALDARAAAREKKEEAEARELQQQNGATRSAVVSAVVGTAKGVASAASLIASAIPLPAPAPPSLILPRVPGARAAASAAAASRGGRGLLSSLVSSSTLASFVGGAALLSAVAAASVLPSRSFDGAASVGGITARQQHAQSQQQQPRRSMFSGLGRSSSSSTSSSSSSSLPPAPVRSAGATSTSSSSSTSASQKKITTSEQQQQARPSPLARFSSSLAQARAAALPTQRKAEAAIGAWHSAKAAALGPRHDTSRLPATTAEPWRSAVEKDAAASRSSGWFWTFKLRGLRVEKVEGKGNANVAVAHARVREAGDLYARTGKHSDGHSYDNAYSAEYTLVRSPSNDSEAGAGAGQWKVAGVLVTGEPRSRSA